MKTLKQLYDERAVIAEQQRDIVRNAENESRDMSEEEFARFEKFESDYSELTKQINKADKLEQFRLRDADQKAKEQEERKPEKKATYNDVFNKYAFSVGGVDSLTAQERQMLIAHRTQTVGTNSAGGFLVPQGFSNELEKRMALFGGMLQVSRMLRTNSGEAIPWPTVDDTSNSGALLTEASTFTDQDATFSSITFDAYTYHSKQIKVSVQLLQDNFAGEMGIQDLVFDLCAERLGRILNQHFTTGSGSSQPNGFETSVVAASGTRNMAANNAITRTELVNLLHDVDPLYRTNARFMFNDGTLATIKALSIGSSDDRPLWQPSMRQGEPDLLEGYPYTINQDMDSIGGSGNLYPVAFGDFSKYVIRMVRDFQFLRLNERYMDTLTVGFSAWVRADGDLIQTNAIKLLRTPTT